MSQRGVEHLRNDMGHLHRRTARGCSPWITGMSFYSCRHLGTLIYQQQVARLFCLVGYTSFMVCCQCATNVKKKGFVALGPDYLFGSSFQDVPADHDRFPWAQTARAAAIEIFQWWLDGVKAMYGKPSIGTYHFPLIPILAFVSLLRHRDGQVHCGWCVPRDPVLESSAERPSPSYCFGAPFVLDLAAEGTYRHR